MKKLDEEEQKQIVDFTDDSVDADGFKMVRGKKGSVYFIKIYILCYF
jgi:hypothetical protein